jgi:hypothetical protein
MNRSKITSILLLLGLFFALSGCAKEGSTTTEVTRDSFLGTWSVSESYTKLSYEVTIVADPNSANGVLISGFANTLPSGPYTGAVISGSKITLDANQVIGDGLSISGGGNLSGKTITWNYTIDDGATLLHAVAIYTRL